MLTSFAYRLACKILSAVAIVARRDVSSEAELLVLRHERTVLRRHVKKVCYRTEDRLWFAALSALNPRRRLAEVFPVTPGTMLARHRKLAADDGRLSRGSGGEPPRIFAILCSFKPVLGALFASDMRVSVLRFRSPARMARGDGAGQSRRRPTTRWGSKLRIAPRVS